MKRANTGERLVMAVVLVSAVAALAERPPPAGQAPAEYYATPDGVGGPTPGARFLGTLNYATRNELRKDGSVVLEKKGTKFLRAVIRLERPIEEVYAIITQPTDQARYLPHVDASKSVGGRSEEGESVDMVVSFLFVTFNYRVQHWFYPEQQRMEWTLDPTAKNELDEQVGYFQLYKLDAKTTIAEYGTRVVAKDGFVNFVRGLGERGGIAEALTAIRKHVASARQTR